jgi:hypothetical protein
MVAFLFIFLEAVSAPYFTKKGGISQEKVYMTGVAGVNEKLLMMGAGGGD